MGSASSVITHDVSKDEFKAMLGEEFYSDGLFNKLKNANNVIPKDRFIQYISAATDCFLTHDWGKDELNRDTHPRVSVINRMLQQRGIKTWFDDDAMKGDVQQQMGDGIDNCGCIIVFVTMRYMDKVAGKGEKKELDNCLYEFSHASQTKGRAKMIPVVMEPRCKDTGAWFGKVGQNLGGLLYTEYVRDDDLNKVVDDICKKVLDIVKLPITQRIQNFLQNKTHQSTTQLQSNIPQQSTQNDAVAQFQMGFNYEQANNFVEAAKCYRKAADQGELNAMNNLGLYYFTGKGVTQNMPEGVKWYQKAAEKGNALAQSSLGICYFNGHGIAQNIQEAAKWYRKAADQGMSVAQVNLGTCYLNGNGVPQNFTEAVKWYQIAANQGFAPGQSCLGGCYLNGQGVAQNFMEAAKWFHLAANQGIVEAQHNLGSCFFNGHGVPQNLPEAAKWLQLAANQGFVPSQQLLAVCYQQMGFVPQQMF